MGWYAVPMARQCTHWALVEADSKEEALSVSEGAIEGLPHLTNWEETGEVEDIDLESIMEVDEDWEL